MRTNVISMGAGVGALLLAAALRVVIVEGNSQVVLETSYMMESTSCEGVACRRQIVGAAEAHGLGAHTMCTSRAQYVDNIISTAPPTRHLFELVYTCKTLEGTVLETEEECGATVCVDAGTNPFNSEITYQIAFEHTRLEHNIVVDLRLYFSFMSVTQTFYEMRAEAPTSCELAETCHRACGANESRFDVVLSDTMGDGWNAGGLGKYDHFWLDTREAYDTLVPDAWSPSQDDGKAQAASRAIWYENTLLTGYERTVPLCLANGEYLFSTELLPWPLQESADHTTDAGTEYSESSWSFCGAEGGLSDYTHVKVQDGYCIPISGWAQTASPAVTPVSAYTPAPTSSAVNPPGTDTPTPNLPAVDTPVPTQSGDGLYPMTPVPTQSGDGLYPATPQPTQSGDGLYPMTPMPTKSGDGLYPVTPQPTIYGISAVGDDDSFVTADDGHYAASTLAPMQSGDGLFPVTPQPTTVTENNSDDDDNTATTHGGTTEDEDDGIATWKILVVAFSAVGAALVAAAAGLRAHKKGWFAAVGGGGVAAAGGAAGAPDPNVDEFAP